VDTVDPAVAADLVVAIHTGDVDAVTLLAAGADVNWVPDYADGTPLDAARNRGTQRDNVVKWLEEQGARSATVRGDS
jgi:hypothetical protein